MGKPCLGFKTRKEATAAIQAIVWKYPSGSKFFDPLIQQLFLEQPYWCDPPGPRFTRFKWGTKALPNGAINDRAFMGYEESIGWVTISFQKALRGKRMTVIDVLTDFTRERVMSLTTHYRAGHPYCEHCCPGMVGAVDAHHTVPLQQMVEEAAGGLTEAQNQEIMAHYTTWRGIKSFTLPDDHPFTAHILQQHRKPGILVSLCRRCHNTAHGKQTHTG